jgi:type I restriction enzyme, R subunit
MRNFDYIRDLGLNDLYRYCSAAEENQVSHPDISAINARRALEYIVRALYFMKNLEVPERASLFELVDGEPFREFINDDKVMMAVHYVRKVGNNGAHAGNVTKKESFFALLNIYNVVGAILLKLKVVDDVKPFDRTLIPDRVEVSVLVPDRVEVAPTDTLVTEGRANREALESSEAVVLLPNGDLSEAETRALYIDLMLREAGWEVLTTDGAIQPLKACIEVELQGMPNAHNVGYADYVLFGGNGLPLAVVEAKRTTVSPIKGKHQAELYADCLEARYGQRPVIYYSNGFETYVIDGLGYPPRRIYAFHSAKDLEWIIQQRSRHAIADFSVKDSITDRHYQKMAIKAVCEHYNAMHRKGLLVMATGTGKTRVAISFVDVLQRNGWVKNVLFLADRISLVKQAHKNFVKLLPNTTTCVLSDNNADKDLNARIVFSTYQTMINYIDTENKLFSVGRFDLIIIDEAHRSIFGKYGAIFNYFDALMLGLTATPREEVDRSTYDIFELEQGEPNYAYELEEAVSDGYLVNYHGFKRGSLILKEGIKYDKLSDEEKQQLDAVWEYEQTRKALEGRPMGPRDIDSKEIFSYIFNADTVDKVLQDLMENGLKVQSGERIGKTIIFAYNHHHAELIVERFNVLYPEYGAGFCVLIDNYVTYSQDLIDKFEVRDAEPQIAVSVDMLDTGIDVPDILNLVFFKIVKSKIKFMQMIGRGTRLSEDIFGNGKNKECFYIFDWCRNFEYFEKNSRGAEGVKSPSLTEKLFSLRAEIAFHLQDQQYQIENPFAKTLHDDLKTLMHEQVCSLPDSHISVREKWEEVSKFKNPEAWRCLTDVDVWELENNIAPLIPKSKQDENAKRFDVLTLTIELSIFDQEIDAGSCVNRVQIIADKLSSKSTLPQVQAKIETINEVISDTAWQNVSLNWLEKVRLELRDLMKFLVGENGKKFVVDIDDIISGNGESNGVNASVSYKKKVIDFLAENRDLPVLKKIYNLEQLTQSDILELERILWQELGTKDDYDRFITEKDIRFPHVAALIRSLIGIDRKQAMQRFGNFISNVSLNSEQEEFLSSIISFVSLNGDITRDLVVNEEPFDEKLEVFNDYMIPLSKYIDNLHMVIDPTNSVQYA